MKEIIKNYIVLAGSILLVIFCITYLFANAEGTTLSGYMGNIFGSIKEKNSGSEGYLMLEKIIDSVPSVKYVGGTRHVGDIVYFKEMIAVCQLEEIYQTGIEDDFSIYFEDIQDKNGNSVVTYLNTEEIEALEEIPTAFIFDRQQEQLYFHKSGTFVMYIKIYTNDGRSTTYMVPIPVETN